MPTYTPRVLAISEQLGETAPQAIKHIARVVSILGVQPTLDFVERAIAVQAAGGMLRPDGAPRTLGGIFFQLVKADLTEEQRQKIFWTWQPKAKPPGVTMTADELHAQLAEALHLTTEAEHAQLTRLIALAGVQLAHDALARAERGDEALPFLERYHRALRDMIPVKQAVWVEALTGEAPPPPQPKTPPAPKLTSEAKAAKQAAKQAAWEANQAKAKGAAKTPKVAVAPAVAEATPQLDAQLEGLAQMVAAKFQAPHALSTIRAAPVGVHSTRSLLE